MTLAIRMALYALFSSLGTISWLAWNPATGVLTVQVDGLAQAAIAYGGFLATFLWSRIAKRRGGIT